MREAACRFGGAGMAAAAAAAAGGGLRVRGGCMGGEKGRRVCVRTRLLCVPLRGGDTGAKKAQVEEKVGSIYLYIYTSTRGQLVVDLRT